VFLAVNTRDTQAAFNDWVPKHSEFSALSYAIDTNPPEKAFARTLYNAPLIPTWIVINKDGLIVKTIIGFSGPNDDLENGIKAAQSGV
jgi:hypothetical protein